MKKRMLIAGLLVVAMVVLLLVSCGADSVPEESGGSAGSGDTELMGSSAGTESSDASETSSVVSESNIADESSDTSGDEPEPAVSSESGGADEDPSQPTESSEGSESSVGNTSSESETSKQQPTETGSTHKHSYKDTVVKPTCTEKGYTLHKCSCGDSYTDKETDALGHYLVSDGGSMVEPTDTKRGSYTVKCWNSGCSYTESRMTCSYNEFAAMIIPHVLDWVNKYRAEEGVTPVVQSNKLTAFDQYRAKQLTTNFAHSREDANAAAEALHVGCYYSDYVNVSTGEFIPAHWTADQLGGEVIAAVPGVSVTKAVVGDPKIEESFNKMAKTLVDQFWRSPAHKQILMEKYSSTYVGIGVYGSCVCITIGSNNQDDTGYEHYWYDEDGNTHFEYVKED